MDRITENKRLKSFLALWIGHRIVYNNLYDTSVNVIQESITSIGSLATLQLRSHRFSELRCLLSARTHRKF